MANPSLKAQIEAAKSALASGLAAPSREAPLPQDTATQPTAPQPTADDTATSMHEPNMGPNTKANNAETSQNARGTHGQSGIGATQNTDQSAAGITPPMSSAAALDERIARLEAKLAENQRDLHSLLQKIREVSRFQDPSNQAAKPPIADAAAPRRRHFKPTIMIVAAVLAGLMIGLVYFVATENFDVSSLTLAGWIFKILQSFSG